jgi:erythromycin esterase
LWMWRNQEVKDLVRWMYDFNSELDPGERVGFYGVDLYAKQQSMQDVIDWFQTIDTGTSRRAEQNYRCLSRFAEIRDYLMRVNRTGDDCSQEVETVLEIIQKFSQDPEIGGTWGYFNAEQNAKLVINAERHFRANLEHGPASWNHRAGHFELTSKRLLDYYGDDSQGIVWAHNTHIGDARATDMGRQGMVNIGQLSRERWGMDNVYAIGFGTYEGEVYAARQWEGNREAMQVPQAISGSWENILNETGLDQFYLLFSSDELINALDISIPHRAIGVTYQPGQERQGNYVNTVLPDRYNAFIFIQNTGVLDALD